MATPQEEQLNANIELLLSIQLEGVDPAVRTSLTSSMNKIREEYRKAVEKEKTDPDYKNLTESIAKGLPTLVKGAYAASEAFQNGDPITGSAALMDICATVIPVFTSLVSAAPPAGTLVAALFSVVGQILSFFAPKQPSLKDEIDKMLNHQQSEKQLQDLGAIGTNVGLRATWARLKCTGGDATWARSQSLAGTVSVTPGLNTVTGTATKFTTSTQAGQWLMFDSDTSRTVYKIDVITSDENLRLSTPYNGAPSVSTPVKYLRRTTTTRSIDDILAMPLQTIGDARAFEKEMAALNAGLRDMKNDVEQFTGWQVAAYLKRPENQSKEGWPEVLGVWCRTYTDMLAATTMVSCMVDQTALERRLDETEVLDSQEVAETEEKAHLPITRTRKTACNAELANLRNNLTNLGERWQLENNEIGSIVDKIKPAARERGLYAHLGYKGSPSGFLVPEEKLNILYIATGNGKKDPLTWTYKSNTAWLRNISIFAPREPEGESFTPKYELLACEAMPFEIHDPTKRQNRILRHSLDSITGTVSNGVPIIAARANEGERFYDLAGIAINDETVGIDFSTQPETLVALAIQGRGPSYLNYYTVDKDGKSTRINTQPALEGAKNIRCLYLPPTTLPNDLDGDAMVDSNANPPGPALLRQNSPVVYGGVRDANHLWVVAWNSWARVKGPQNWTSYNGIEVDPYYVWLFGKDGIACATHASIIKCRQGKIPAPSWIYHDFDKQFTQPEVISLYPCADETLMVSMLNEIYTADYKIDRSKNRILTSSWLKRGGQAAQVIKMPIPCWSLLQSLRERLRSA
jgi:hypothetical protein